MSGISKSLIGNSAHVSQPYIIQHNKSHQCWHMLNSNCKTGCSHGCWLFCLDQREGAATEHGNYKEGRRDQRQEKLSFSFKLFLAEQVSTALNIKGRNDTDASITSGNAQLSCRGSAKHIIYFMLQGTDWLVLSKHIHSQKRDSWSIWGSLVSIPGKKKRECFYLALWRGLSNCHFSLIPGI